MTNYYLNEDNPTLEGGIGRGALGVMSAYLGIGAGKLIAKYGAKSIFKGLTKNMGVNYRTAMEIMGGGVKSINKTVNGITSRRMIKGWANGKVAVIGRGMDKRVSVFANGIDAEIFTPSKKAMNMFNNGDDSLLYNENKAWIRKLKDNGYTIYDTGTGPISNQKGKFYGMETKEIFGD